MMLGFEICRQTERETEVLVGTDLNVLRGIYGQKRDQYGSYPELVRRLFLVDGVTSVSIQDQKYSIGKAPVYEWADVLKQVFLVIENYRAGAAADSVAIHDDSLDYSRIMKRHCYLNSELLTVHLGCRVSDFNTYQSPLNYEIPLVAALMAIDGIDDVYLDQYSVNLRRKWSARWHKLNPIIEDIILSHLDSMK